MQRKQGLCKAQTGVYSRKIDDRDQNVVNGAVATARAGSDVEVGGLPGVALIGERALQFRDPR